MMACLYTSCNDVISIRNGYHGNAAGTMAATAQSSYKFNLVQEVGGVLELAPGYLREVYSIVRKAEGLCIADEVQSGFARTGSHFWGYEDHVVVPDIVTVAKGIGNGMPLGAVITTHDIAKVLADRRYFNTSFIGDVRGRGFLLGVELVTHRELKTPAKDETLHVMEQMKGAVLFAYFLVDVMDNALSKM